MATIISIINQKGGVGKTSTVIEIASWMSTEGKKVLAVDLDQQTNLTKYSGVNLDGKTIYEVLRKEATIDEIIETVDFGKRVCFDIARGTSKLSDVERQFTDRDDAFLLADILVGIDENKYDYILIDTNPARNTLLQMAYAASDYAILPTNSDDGSLDGIVAIYKDIKKYREGRSAITNVKILSLLLTRFKRSNSYKEAEEKLQELASLMDEKPSVDIIHESIKVSDCKSYQVPLVILERSNPASLDYKDFTKSVIERLEGDN